MKQVNMMSVQEWDSLVESTYGRRYSFQQQDGCKDRGVETYMVPCESMDYENSDVPEEVNGEEMGVSFAAWLARDPKRYLSGDSEGNDSFGESVESMSDDMRDFDRELWWERNFYPHASMLVNDLHSRGLLPAGELVIEIDW